MADISGSATESDVSHKETTHAVLKRHEQQIIDLIDHISSKVIHPFDISLHLSFLMHISTGMFASKEVQDEGIIICGWVFAKWPITQVLNLSLVLESVYVHRNTELVLIVNLYWQIVRMI